MKKHRLLYVLIAFFFMLSFIDCAKRGTPSGGAKDSIPPVIVKSTPENYSTLFDATEIRIYFDEYIKLKNLQQELIISPPLKYQPSITPLSTSKYIKIKILDTLKENSTYSFNFGNSIVDNNEENAFEYFKYLFSTGSYIDSLKLRGTVKDAKLINPETPVTVMLYEVKEGYKDSIIFSEKPNYITSTRGSSNSFELTNIKEGSYLLIALKEINNDYIFQPKTDKIGFVKEYISIPTDSSYNLTLFKEIPEYAINRPKQISKHHVIFGYEGRADQLYIGELFDTAEAFKKMTYKDHKTDTIHYWFQSDTEKDSLRFLAINNEKVDTLTLRIRIFDIDSLRVTAINSGIVRLTDTIKLSSNTPLISIDPEKIIVMDKDSVPVEVSGHLKTEHNLAEINFSKTEDQSYRIQLLPGALTDFYKNINDTLNYGVRTKATSEYGTLSLSLNDVKSFPLIVQLVSNNFEVISEKYLKADEDVFFDHISPGNYYVRVIYDTNKNMKWDTGNFLQGLQPEEVIYYPSLMDIRANWSLNETFTLD